jgi:hypothetical protein
VRHEPEVGARLADGERHPQRVEHEVGAHVAGELPADDHPREHVDDEREVQDTLPAAQIREIADPQAVRGARGEVPANEVRPPFGLRIGCCGPPRLAAALGALDPVIAHQPLHLAARDPLALAQQLLPRAPVPVALVVGPVHATDLLEQPLILDAAR